MKGARSERDRKPFGLNCRQAPARKDGHVEKMPRPKRSAGWSSRSIRSRSPSWSTTRCRSSSRSRSKGRRHGRRSDRKDSLSPLTLGKENGTQLIKTYCPNELRPVFFSWPIKKGEKSATDLAELVRQAVEHHKIVVFGSVGGGGSLPSPPNNPLSSIMEGHAFSAVEIDHTETYVLVRDPNFTEYKASPNYLWVPLLQLQDYFTWIYIQ